MTDIYALPGWQYETYSDGTLALRMWREFSVSLDEGVATVKLGLWNPESDALLFVSIEASDEDCRLYLKADILPSQGEPDVADTLETLARVLRARAEREARR
jgi:hypothetical protein